MFVKSKASAVKDKKILLCVPTFFILNFWIYSISFESKVLRNAQIGIATLQIRTLTFFFLLCIINISRLS